jgi:hypothetical protein
MSEAIKQRLEYLRQQLDNECISWLEINELQGLAEHIDLGDVQLLEAASVPEENDDEEITIPLPNGGSLRCGPGESFMSGGYLRICDGEGRELLYWDKSEWEIEGEGEFVIGAVFRAASMPMDALLYHSSVIKMGEQDEVQS